MLLLPIFNARLNPCPVSPAEFSPHAQGKFCGQCQRVVHDFSQSTNPRADLAAARAAAPDGRVCGRFGAAQVQAAPLLLQRLRWFVAALVLVVAQGLSAREALAQVRRAVPHHTQSAKKRPAPAPAVTETLIDGDIAFIDEKPLPAITGREVYSYVEQMPTFRGGGIRALMEYIQKQVQWPRGTERVDAEGRVFASFVVGKDGAVRDAKILKGLHPLLDAEALRVILALTGFTAGRQDDEPVAVNILLPITFRRK